MKKLFAIILIVTLFLCGCSPYKPVIHDDDEIVKVTVYICGAVQDEGRYSVEVGSTVFSAVEKAGLLDVSYVADGYILVSTATKQIFVPYKENGSVNYSLDVNNALLDERYENVVNTLSLSVVRKIVAYRNEFGIIHNKKQLAEILGEEDYASCHYKLYITEADYEEAD